MSDLITRLGELGFTSNAALAQSDQAAAIADGAGNGGDFTITTVLTKDQIKVTVQQNDASEDVGGLTAVVQHPPVAVIESPKGRVAFNPTDVALAEVLVGEFS